jgi:hypothetical protein
MIIELGGYGGNIYFTLSPFFRARSSTTRRTKELNCRGRLDNVRVREGVPLTPQTPENQNFLLYI